MGDAPHIVIVRRDHDFRIVETSRDFPFAEAVRDEARWLALDWWGNCFLEAFRGALGHFPSTAEPGLFHLMLVLPGTVAPDRFIVCLRDEQYAPLLYDPFRSFREGLFGLTRSFYESRGEGRAQREWSGAPDDISPAPMTEEEQGLLQKAEQHLVRGTSVVVPSRSDDSSASSEIARFAGRLHPGTRRSISICTFTNAGRDQLMHFGTAFCALYSTTTTRTLAEVLAELVPLDERGSPFRPIRRTSV
jgi:hypothetical protein